jgi:pimeloyl-ACP methyl ester carboxylesterase
MSKISGLIIAVLSMVLLTSCSSTKISKFTLQKMIAIDAEGGPRLYDVKHKGKVIPAEEYTYEQQLNGIIDGIKKSGRRKILIFVFGGMNSLDQTVAKSDELSKIIYSKSDYYPIFINWESQLFDCYFDHLFFIRRGVYSYTLGPVLSPFYLVSDVARAVTRLPVNLIYQSYGLAYSDYEMPQLDEATVEKIRKMKIQVCLGKDYSPRYYAYVRRGVYFLGFPFRVLTTTLIDNCGKSAWDVMKRRSRTMFIKAYPYETGLENEIKLALSPPDGAMALFMDRMITLNREDPKKYEITVIGHSMGPIIVNEMVTRYPELPFKNIVFMAAACSTRETVKALKPYLKMHPKTMFYNLCIHPNRDSQDMMTYGVLPRGSVLEWIDLFFANPISESDMCIGQWVNAMYLLPRMMRGVEHQVVNKAFGVDDPETNTIRLNMPEQHTDFSNPVLRFWKPSFWKIPPVIKARQNENNNKFIRVKTFKTLPLYPREIIIEDSQHPDNDSDTEQDKK